MVLLPLQIHTIFISSDTKVDRLSVFKVWDASNGFTDRTGTHIAKVFPVPPLLKATFREDRDTQGHGVLELHGQSFHHTSLNLFPFPLCLYPSNL